jgi:transcriptional regulator with XRE-family HTH domain
MTTTATEEKPIGHIGKKIERIRTIRGVKQDDLAARLNVTQGAISRMEQSEHVDDERLRTVADALGVTVDAIKNFDEDALLATSNFFNPHFQDQATAVINQFNPIEKIVELYEQLLTSERKRIELLEAQLNSKK